MGEGASPQISINKGSSTNRIDANSVTVSNTRLIHQQLLHTIQNSQNLAHNNLASCELCSMNQFKLLQTMKQQKSDERMT